MKKIFTIFAIALAMGFAFTSCASKKAADKGPKVYRVNIGTVLGGPVEISEEPTELNITSLFRNEKFPVAGETIRVMWSLRSDSDVKKIFVKVGDDAQEYLLGEDIAAENECYIAVNIPVKEDMTGPVYATIWSDAPALCTTSYVDAK